MKVVKALGNGEWGGHLCLGRRGSTWFSCLPSIRWFCRWNKHRGGKEHTRPLGLSQAGRPNHISVHSEPESCEEVASHTEACHEGLQRSPLWTHKSQLFNSPSSQTSPCFSTFPIQCPAFAVLLLVSSSSRGQAGERRGVVYCSQRSLLNVLRQIFWVLRATNVFLSNFFFFLNYLSV